MSSSNCCFLACIQVAQKAGQVAWYSQLLKNFPQFAVIHMLKGFSIVSEAEVDVFWNSFAFSMIQQMLAIWLLVPVPLLNPTWPSGHSWFTYCWSLAWRILSITLLACGMTAVVQKPEDPLVLPFFGIRMKIDFSSPGATAVFPKFADILSAAFSQHHLLGFGTTLLEFHHLH